MSNKCWFIILSIFGVNLCAADSSKLVVLNGKIYSLIMHDGQGEIGNYAELCDKTTRFFGYIVEKQDNKKDQIITFCKDEDGEALTLKALSS